MKHPCPAQVAAEAFLNFKGGGVELCVCVELIRLRR